MHANTQNHGHIGNLTNHFGMQITNYPVNQIYGAVIYVNMHSLYISVDNLSFKILCNTKKFDLYSTFGIFCYVKKFMIS